MDQICDLDKKYGIIRDFAGCYNCFMPFEQHFNDETIELAKIIGQKENSSFFPLMELEFLLKKFSADEILNHIYSQYERETHPEYNALHRIDFNELYVPYRGAYYYIDCLNLEDVYKYFREKPDSKEFWFFGTIELKTKKIGVDVQFTFDSRREKWMISKVEKYEDVEENCC